MKFYNFVMGLFRIFCNLFFRYEVSGTENIPDTGNIVIAANHKANIDPVFVAAAIRNRKVAAVAKKELFDIKPLGYVLKKLNVIPIDRDNPGISTIKSILKLIKDIKIDPLIHCSERKSDGEVISYNPEINDILEIMKKSNYIHHGFNQYFETTKPRWNAVIKMTMDNEKLFVNLNKNIRNKIRKSINKGVEIYQGTSEDIPTFFEFIKKKHNRPLSYYQKLENLFTSENVEFYFAKINPEIFVINSKNKYEKELDRNEELNLAIQTHKGMDIRRILNEKMESDKLTNNYKMELIEATKLLQDHPEGITIGACCIIKYDKGIYLLIDGFNQKYSKFNASTRLISALKQLFAYVSQSSASTNASRGSCYV